MKKLEGQQVYLIPTGNNVRRYKKVGHTMGKVVKVARVFVTLKISGTECKFRINSINKGSERVQLEDEGNSGFILVKSLQEVMDYYEQKKLARIICNACQYISKLERLNVNKLREISEIMGLNKEEV